VTVGAEGVREVTFDDLPGLLPWARVLLGSEAPEVRRKTREAIEREFERDKWGSLLKALEAPGRRWGVGDAERWFIGDEETVFSAGDRLCAGSALAAQARFVDEVAARLLPFLPAEGLVELGAGYGGVLLNLAKRTGFEGIGLAAGELTAAGVECLRRLAAVEGLAVHAGRCDFTAPGICRFEVAPGSAIYTCGAVPYVRELTRAFVDDLRALGPAAVVHIEPCPEHYGDDPLGRLRSAYASANDYNRNLVSLLHERAEAGDITLLREEKCFFGPNCLLPFSLVAWVPARGVS